MHPLILRVNVTGNPMGWLHWQEAVHLYTKGAIAWAIGDEDIRIYGATNRITGEQSFIDLKPVIAARGIIHKRSRFHGVPPLNNRELFRRDQGICLYCLHKFPENKLTRDHVIPLSRQGQDTWTNVVTACVRCNQFKANRTPEESGLKLHAVPYEPNYAEWLILRNRRIRADQMAFLQAHCPKGSPLRS